LRRAMDQHSELGEHVRKYVENGEYVPDEIMVPAAMHEIGTLRREWHTSGVVLDGFPRTREQAEALDQALAADQNRGRAVLSLAGPNEVLIARLSGRRICRNCGATYHLETKPPKVAGICDVCGHTLVQREDDGRETAERRLQVYSDSTLPLVDYYRERG